MGADTQMRGYIVVWASAFTLNETPGTRFTRFCLSNVFLSGQAKPVKTNSDTVKSLSANSERAGSFSVLEIEPLQCRFRSWQENHDHLD